MKPNKPVYVTKAFLPPFEEFVEGLKLIWESALLTNQGPVHNQLAEHLKIYLKVKGAVLFVNGHQALEIALKSFNLQGEVITTPFTFASTTHAIVQCGLTPVFCDIRQSDYNINESLIESLITEKTSAILPVHVYGNPCNVEEINRIAQKYGLKVIYDAAHAFGVQVNGVGIGSFGDVSMFSFHATKVFNTIEGGAITFSDLDLERSLYLLKNFGIAGPEEVLQVGTNAKMNEIQALMGLINLRYVDHEIELRQKVVNIYRQLLAGIPGICCLPERPNVKSNYSYFPILVDESAYGLNRDQLFQKLADRQIIARKYFYPLVTDYACYKDVYPGDIPVSRYVASRVISLPLWGEIPEEVVAEICEIIREG
jgi:dTDP-4-amino-4,6-dideoxygalactose transaminase